MRSSNLCFWLIGCVLVFASSGMPADDVFEATWISKALHGAVTASGELYNVNELTAAHATLPLGAFVRVTNLSNDRSVVVRVNDRKSKKARRIIAVSWRAARVLGMLEQGRVPVKLDIVSGFNKPMRGKATWISKRFHGLITASGERYENHKLSAAHATLPFGTYVRVTNLSNGRSVIVRISDRKARSNKCIIALSWRAAQMIGMLDEGTADVELAEITGEMGIASWYGGYFHGRTTANGETYDQDGMTAAHKALPFNTRVRVTNLENGKSVLVRINDRGPFVGERIIDLSREAARRIDMLGPGTAKVLLEILP